MQEKKYDKILIANRGEVACRIIKTAHKMGISCVCVYSDADIHSLHVRRADEARYIGSSPAYLSYLNIDKIFEIALETGVQAVHPGYGFLSENPNLPRILQKNNIDFIGPSAEIIEVTANKITAKESAKAAGLNIVPGYIGTIQDTQHAIQVAEEIGFPVILKAMSGGGGKGMRIVNSKKDIESSLELTINEAKKGFKDGNIFIEQYITLSRHIEIQIIADKYGNIVCLGDRECSVQRKNQKIIEEAPSSFLSEHVRQEMYMQCIALAKHVGYFSVGTIEFIVDSQQNFYFLEINTRLQVEHPVTEFVTGIDIVEEMIKISRGSHLGFNQKDIKTTGHAIESRICAENPSKNFLPSSGRIQYYQTPNHLNNVRIDDGILAGSEIGTFYDSMIAKVITYGINRIDAISKMQKALSEFYIEGIMSNIEFLESIFRHPHFIASNINTRFIVDYYPSGFHGDYLTEEYIKIFIFTALYVHIKNEVQHYYYNSSGEVQDSKIECKKIISATETLKEMLISNTFIVKINDNSYNINAIYQDQILIVMYNHNIYYISGTWTTNYRLIHMTINEELHLSLKVDRQDCKFFIRYAGMHAECDVLKPHIAILNNIMLKKTVEETSNDIVISPISGLLVKLYVNIGDHVEIGQPLFVVEAMKMENIVCAESALIVQNISIQVGETLRVGDIVLSLAKYQ
ncbi:ATP-binding protein [Wolbachia endosymbiont of Howardula sp.]|uniref:ATP-binding protein n=1 Tax=Wolbachia endosymbiont of Howardula sp. TaxID=2916816 RepID=UPI00217CD5F0|nr:biotin carboxylase N-terminal domain-containing protein [Wolbachia endosymbiont of Howardula sp.]UWI83420.1 ATP-grasp domain-containing protein [Wolbachia endosymbiont of Howardula sp.]